MQIIHVDTCLPCYVLDHCNGDNEALVGVPVDRATRHWQLRESLEREIFDYCDKIPADKDEELKAAIAELFAGVHPLSTFDSSLEPAADDWEESCMAWFRVTW